MWIALRIGFCQIIVLILVQSVLGDAAVKLTLTTLVLDRCWKILILQQNQAFLTICVTGQLTTMHKSDSES